jgi:osmotically-inducible protein OsmY
MVTAARAALFVDAQTLSPPRPMLRPSQPSISITMKTDLQLQKDVSAELQWEPAVHAAQIGVEVKDGVVTLAGEVSRYAEKWNAERAAQRVHGVKALAVEMTVKLGEFGHRSDTASVRYLSGVKGVSNQIALRPTLSASMVKADIEATLKRRATVDASTISVAVDGGNVTLTGPVHSWAERELATTSAWGSAGVRQVVDKMDLVY